MKIFEKTALFIFLIFSAGILFAQNLERSKILAPETESQLLKENELNHLFADKENAPNFIPQTEYGKILNDFVFGKFNPKEVGYSAEKLYRVKKSDLQYSDKENLDISRVATKMRSISTMKGMQYFSRSRKEWDTLYSQSFRVENPDEKKPSPAADVTTGNADGQELYAFVNDHTFGECIYKITYKQSQNEFLMIMQNHTYISYGPVKAVKPGNLKMCVLVIDCGDEFLFYIANYTECKIPSFLKPRMNNSFEARLEAIYNWFKSEN